jgi:gliding motility-associated-like protein
MSITVTNSVLPTFTQLGPYCLNATPGLLPLISTNGIAGTWSPSVVNTSTVGSTTYTFTPAAGSCGSSTTMSITVTNSVLPTFTQLGPYCLNATPGLLPLISTNGIAGTWSPSVVNTSTVGSTTYTFTPAAGSCGSSTTMSITVTNSVLPTFTQLGPYCLNATPGLLPLISTNGIAGTWSPAVVNTSTVGSTTYTFTPAAGTCGSSTTMSITVTNSVLPTFTQLGPYCLNATPGLLPLISTNGIAGTWSPSVVNTSTVGSTTYTFTPAAGTCGSSTTMSITVTNSVLPTFTQLGPYCLNATPGLLPLISTNGIAGTWSPAVVNTSTVGSTTYTFTPAAGTCGSSTTMSITVTNSVLPTFTQLGPYCLNATPGLLPLISTNGIAGTWSPAVVNTSTVGSTTYTFTPAAGSCGSSTTMSITVTNSVLPTFTQLGPYCLNATPGVLPLISANGIAGTWSPSVVNTSTVGSTTYTFTPAAGSCGSSTTMSITVTNSVLPTFTQLGPYCLNATPGLLPLISTNGIAGTWSPAVVNTSTVGSSTYTFTPAAGLCGSQTSQNIDVLSSPTSVVSNISNAMCGLPDGSILLGAVANGTFPFEYNFNNLGFGTNTTFNNLAAGSYPLVIEDANGCIFNTTLFVNNITGPSCNKTSGGIANIFSPNGDGVNDELKIFIGSDIKEVSKFEIFDRWGSKVYNESNIISNNDQIGWNGIHKGNIVNPGVYIYVAIIEFTNGKVETKVGNVTVVY